MLDLALAASVILVAIVVLPIAITAYFCKRRERVLRYVRALALGVVVATQSAIFLRELILLARYQALVYFSIEFCQSHHWTCVFVDSIISHDVSLAFLGGGLLNYLVLKTIVTKKPDLLSLRVER